MADPFIGPIMRLFGACKSITDYGFRYDSDGLPLIEDCQQILSSSITLLLNHSLYSELFIIMISESKINMSISGPMSLRDCQAISMLLDLIHSMNHYHHGKESWAWSMKFYQDIWIKMNLLQCTKDFTKSIRPLMQTTLWCSSLLNSLMKFQMLFSHWMDLLSHRVVKSDHLIMFLMIILIAANSIQVFAQRLANHNQIQPKNVMTGIKRELDKDLQTLKD